MEVGVTNNAKANAYTGGVPYYFWMSFLAVGSSTDLLNGKVTPEKTLPTISPISDIVCNDPAIDVLGSAFNCRCRCGSLNPNPSFLSL